MALQMVLGVPGSGKTYSLYERIIRESLDHQDRQFLVIVPEQSTLQAQREIVAMHPRHGVHNIDILSFQRLAFRVFSELSLECLPVLDDMGKSMVIRKVAAQKRKELALFGGHLDQEGFISQIKSMISELYQYGISPDRIREMEQLAGTDRLQGKLKDLAVLYQGFQEFIEEKYNTAEEILEVLCRVLPGSRLIQGSVVALDGYTGFTPVQYRLLELFLIHSREVRVTVTMDGESYGSGSRSHESLFHMSHQIMHRLTKLAVRHKVAVRPDICLFSTRPYRHLGIVRPALDHLERQVFRYRQSPWEGGPVGEGLVAFQGMNVKEEVGYVVRQILALVREEGMRYRDIALVCGDIEGYGPEIGYQMDQAGIPYFMDDKKNILAHPMVELLRASLEMLMRDFSYESVFRYLKSGMTGIGTEEICMMEAYVRSMGIRGFKRYRQTWDQVSFRHPYLNLERINECRERFMGPVGELREAFGRPDACIRDLIGGLRRLLDKLSMEERLADYAEYLAGMGQIRLAEEYGQVYGMVEDLFVRLEQLLGDERAGRREFAQILDAGFSEIRVGVIPVTVDRVVVGDIMRSRLAHIRALFFVGLNEGVVPAVREAAGILNDSDRVFLEARGVELAPDTRTEGFMQRFYLYLVLTKPQERLYLTFSALNRSGKARRPSSLIGEVRRLFPGLSVRHWEEGPAYTVADGKRQLIQGLKGGAERQDDPEFLELYRWFFRSGKHRREVERILDAVFYSYRHEGIGKAAARQLYGAVLSGSVTRLEQYAACAYAHFLRYGLELREQKDYEVEAMDVGNLFHDSIDRAFRQVQEEGGRLMELSDGQRGRLVSEAVRAAAESYGNTVFSSSARYAYLTAKVERMTERTLWALARQLEKGDFIPSGFEVPFSGEDSPDSMRIPLSNQERLLLRGRIDRIDLCEEAGKLYVKVIDYKSGHTAFDLSDLYYGLQLQLAVYLSAAVELLARRRPDREVLPAGMFYYHIDDPLIDWEAGMGPEEVERRILKKLRMSGLANSDMDAILHLDREIGKESDVVPVTIKDGLVQESRSSVASSERLKALFSFVREAMEREGREILDGRIEARPYKKGTRRACDYCPYHGVCGFDPRAGGYGYRRLGNMKKEDVWREIVPDGLEGEED